MPKAQEKKLKVKRTRVRTGPVKKWTDEEALSMIYYVLDKQNDGKPFEKPTAEIYYEKMITKLQLNVKWQQVKAKMLNFRTKFVQVKTWLDGTGQGVDSGTIEGYKTEKCPFYDLLHAIYGQKANIVIPYQYDSLRASSSKGENRSQTNEDIDLNNDGGSGINDALNTANKDCHQVNDCDSHPENDVGVSANNNDFVYLEIDYDDFDVQDDDITLVDDTYIDLENYMRSSDVCNIPTEMDVQQVSSDVSNRSLEANDTGSKSVLPEKQSKVQQNDRVVTNDNPVLTAEELAFARFARSEESENEEEEERNETRLARFKKELSQRPSDKQSKSSKREIPANASAFISDANMKRVETLHERNRIELRRVENERFEMDISKERFELDKIIQQEQISLGKKEARFKDQELSLKETEIRQKFDLRKEYFELKRKKLAMKEKEKEDEFNLKLKEMEKAERIEKMKIEYELKLQLELAKLKN